MAKGNKPTPIPIEPEPEPIEDEVAFAVALKCTRLDKQVRDGNEGR